MTVSVPSKLKPSDYLQATTIVSSAIATGSAFGVLIQSHPAVVGFFAGVAALSATLGQWLQSKGD